MIKVIGLQRSGTNYLTELLRLNFTEPVAGNIEIFWKHSLPNQTLVELQTGTFLEQKQPIITDCKKVLIVKPIDHWIQSIKRNPADLPQKRPELYIGNTLNELEARRFFIHFFKLWTKHHHVYIVNYTNLLTDLQSELQSLQLWFNLHRTQEPFKDINHVPHSAPFTEADRKKYTS